MEQNNLLLNILGNQSLLDALVNLVIIIAPIFVTYYLRTYVKSTEDEKKVALMSQLAGTAIGYVEDLDGNDQLDDIMRSLGLSEQLIETASGGVKKLNAANKMVDTELKRRGITITGAEIEGVVRGEFQKLTGRLGVERNVFTRTQEALSLLKDLQQAGLVNLPDDVEEMTRLSGHLVDWAVLQLDHGSKNNGRQAALALAQTGLLVDAPAVKPEATSSAVLPEVRLARIARQAVSQVGTLKATLAPSITETEIIISWVLTEALKQGLQVSPEEINQAVRAALSKQTAPVAGKPVEEASS